ncbi:MAG: hypothetical protein EOM64_10050 [Erysipelotrichia bacterium]|nr:hypothetical protein [Erysipelotrichia bacterium]
MNYEDKKKELIRQSGQLCTVSVLLSFLPAVLLIVSNHMVGGIAVRIILTVSLALFLSAVILSLISQWQRSEKTVDADEQPLSAEQMLENHKSNCSSRSRLINSAMIVLISGIGILLVAVIWIVVIG